jgi:cell division protein FtsQ
MLLSKDKRILIYLFLLVFLGSINNKHFNNIEIFKIKNLKLDGLNEKEKFQLLLQLEQVKKKNIFFLPKKELIEILNSNNLIESFLISKNYPSDLNIFVKKTSFLANININKKNFLIGSNKKLIQSESIYSNLPIILGNPSVEDFFSIKNDIQKSLISFKNVNQMYFFPSKRWDLELKNGVLIKLPILNPIESLNNYFTLRNLPQFQKIKIFDMRINNQIIVNEL